MSQPQIRAAVLILVLALPAAAAAQQTPNASVVVVTGEGLVQAPPDRAWITLTAESRAGNPREAQRRNAEIMKPVQDTLRAAGVPADAIRTIAYDLQQEWDFVNNRRVPRGYVARNTIEIRVDEVERVGELLENGVESGATAVAGIRFDVKDSATLEREALRRAVEDAFDRANAVVRGLRGDTIGRVVRIEEHGVVSRPPPPVIAAREAFQASDAPPIAVGQIEFRAQVTLTAELP
ncbi:MAG: SIMPL domain-containing protein [Acidobacteria bacterium]|nr:SIMPL domain-containing protein [Acidobacteriota bacterium]